MQKPNADQASRLLDAAGSASAEGAAAVRRPPWYAAGLAISMGLALGSFAVPFMTTAGVVLGAIILPVTLEFAARLRMGGSPAKSYLEGATRRTALAYVGVGGAVAAISLVILKVTGESWVVLPGALVLAVGTLFAARRVERLRARSHGMSGHRT